MKKKIKVTEACEVFNISKSLYYELAQAGEVPKAENGYIDFYEATRDLISYYQNQIVEKYAGRRK